MRTIRAQIVCVMAGGCGGAQMINDRTSFRFFFRCTRIEKNFICIVYPVYIRSVLCTHISRWHTHTRESFHPLGMLGATARTAATLHRVLDALDVARVRATAAANHFGAQFDPLGHVALERHTVLLARPARFHAVHLTAVRIDDQRQLLGGRSATVQRLEQGRDELQSTYDINACIS